MCPICPIQGPVAGVRQSKTTSFVGSGARLPLAPTGAMAMQVGCGRCGHTLEFSQLPPRFCSNCGQPLAPDAEKAQPYTPPTHTPYSPLLPLQDETIPDAVGGYRLLRLLGSGGM